MVAYAIELARKFAEDKDICLSTDDDNVINVAGKMGLEVPFKRPDYLSTDTAGTYEVLLHALEHYSNKGREYDVLVLLQPTSPFRKEAHLREAIQKYTPDIDMVVSVKESNANPYYNLFEEDKEGYLKKSKNGDFTRYQDCPKVYEYNGAIYVINVDSLKKNTFIEFGKVIKYEMLVEYSVDIDTQYDWGVAEYLIKKVTLP